MPYILEYFLKFSISLGVLYIFYQLALRPLTFYQWNRFYLLGYSLTSFFIPFININSWLDDNIQHSTLLKSVPALESFSLHAGSYNLNDQDLSVNYWNVGLVILAVGSSLMLARLIIQYFSLQRIRQHAVLVYKSKVSLYDVSGNLGHFSFGKSIFVNSRLHSEDELQEIIRHEFVHVRQKHSVDMMIGEIICLVNWFNPFAWLIRRAIRQNLEFIADHQVLKGGFDARQYQYLLLKVIGLSQFSITTNFNFSSLKKRIAMMNKMKSAPVHLVKFLFIAPLLAVMLLAFREKIRVKKEKLVLPYKNENGFVKSNEPKAPVKNVEDISLTMQNSYPGDTVPLAPASPSTPATPLSPASPVPAPPPPPPPPPAAIKLPEGVKRITIRNKEATVIFKNGTKETYNLGKPEEKAAFEKKYGQIEVPPPPPPREPVEISEDKEIEIPPVEPVAPEVTELPETVKSITVNSNVTVTVKNGTTETYDLSKPAEKSKFEKKYGKLPVLPVPVKHKNIEVQIAAPAVPSASAAPVPVKVEKIVAPVVDVKISRDSGK